MKSKLFFLLLLIISSISIAQTTSTIAGNTSGYLDGTGTSAKFNLPQDVALDASGNVYVTDYYNHKIRKITSAGVVSTLAGGATWGNTDGTGTNALFKNPTSLAVNQSTGDVYVADTQNHRIRKITPAGVVTTFAGGVQGYLDGTGTAANFNLPYDLAIDGSTGDVYVADFGNHKIRKITSSGVVTTFAGSTSGYLDGTGTAAKFNQPWGIVVSSWNGDIFVSDSGNNRIRKITAAGVVTTLAGSGTAGSLDGTGTLASFSYPSGLALDYFNNLYVADQVNHRIRKITSTGLVTTLAGNTNGFADGVGTAASFSYPSGLAINPISASNLDLYVADGSNHKIRKIVLLAATVTIPTISNIYASPITNSAKIYYTLNANNANTTSLIKYGLSSGALVNQALGFNASGNSDVSNFTNLTGLSTNTTYYYQIEATNSAGTTASIIKSFTTGTSAAIAEYRFDNSYSNIYGNNPFVNNVGTTFTTDRNGNPNAALNINGTGASATITGLPYSNNARTIAFWAKANSMYSSYNYTFSYGSIGGSSACGGSFNNSTVDFLGYANNLSGTSSNIINTWYFFTYTYDGTNAKIYKNGVLLSTVAKTWNTINNNDLFKLGVGIGGEFEFNGAIDDLKIYNYVLSDADINTIYTTNFLLNSQNFNQNNLEATLFPNPVQDVLNISIENTINSVEIFTIQGQKVMQSNESTINMSSLNSGIYLVKIIDENDAISTKKIIKK